MWISNEQKEEIQQALDKSFTETLDNISDVFNEKREDWTDEEERLWMALYDFQTRIEKRFENIL